MRKLYVLMLLSINLLPMLLLFLLAILVFTRKKGKVKTIDLDIWGCHLILTMS
ncbi:hypothetical protein ABXS75_04075 [Roseburia hominis]